MDEDAQGFINGLHNDAINQNTRNIADNAEIIQTKTASVSATTDNSVARFDGTDGLTITSSDIVVDDSNNIGIGTVIPATKIDIRTPGVIDSQMHISSTDTDGGAYIGSSADNSLTLLAGAAVEGIVYNVEATEANGIIMADGNISFIGDTGLILENVFVPTELMRLESDGDLSLKQGTSTNFVKVGGVIFDHYIDSTVGGAETDIYTDTIVGNSLSSNGDKIVGNYSGNFVTLGTESVQLKAYFAGSNIWDSTGIAMAVGTSSWRICVEIIRVSAIIIRYSVSLNTSGASGFVYETAGELTSLTLSASNVLKITGISSGVGSGVGDIVGKMGYVEWKAAA